MSRHDGVVDVRNVEIVHETDDAILIRTQEGEEVWLPISQVESLHRKGAESWLVVKEWIAVKKGLA